MSTHTTLTTDRRDALVQGSEAQAVRTSHPPQPPDRIVQALQQRAARTSLPDRVAMRIGLWLVLWGTRPARRDRSAIDPRDLREAFLERTIREHQAAVDRARANSGLTAYLGQYGR